MRSRRSHGPNRGPFHPPCSSDNRFDLVREITNIQVVKRRFQFLTVLFLLLASSNPLLTQWLQTNGPYGGNVYGLVQQGSVVLAATDGGVFRADTSREHWTMSLDMPFARSLVGNESVLFTIAGNRLFRSTDRGASWQMIDRFSYYARMVAMEGNLVLLAEHDSLLLSSDNGETWKPVPPPSHAMRALLINNNELYIWSDGLYRSTDSGTTWVQVYNNYTLTPYFAAFAANRHSLFLSLADEVFRSDDDGAHWNLLSTNNPGWVFFSLTVRGDTIFAGTAGDGAYLSTDNGNSWQHTGLLYVRCQTFLLADSMVYAGLVDGGVYRSSDGGDSWRIWNDGLNAANVSNVVGTSTENLFALSAGYVYHSTDRGISWVLTPQPAADRMITPPDNNRLSVHILQDGPGTQHRRSQLVAPIGKMNPFVTNGNVYDQPAPENSTGIFQLAMERDTLYLQNRHQLFRSTDSARTFNLVREAWSMVGEIISIGPSGMFTTGSDTIFRSLDHGLTWQPFVLTGHGNEYIESIWQFGNGLMFASAFSTGSPGIYPVIAALFRSTDNGETWKTTDLTNQNYLTMAKLNETYFAASEYGLYRGELSGTLWKMPINFTEAYFIMSLAAVENTLYVSCLNNGNIFAVTNGGLTNTLYNDGYRGILTGELLAVDSYLFLTTQTNGLWRRDLNDRYSNEWNQSAVAADFHLEQNFPNPVNPTTVIRYSLPTATQVRLTIYNTLGQEVSTLVNGIQDAGYKLVKWTAAAMPSGVYFYRLQAGQFSETKKLLLLR